MRDESASDLLRQHAAKGRKIHSDLLMARQSKLYADSNVAAGVDALDLFFDLSGRKRLAKNLGRRLMHSRADTNISELNRRTNEWISEANVILKRISVLRRGIPSKPNSDALVRSFSAKMKYATPETRLSHGIQYLENLAESRLIFNDEIVQRKIVTEVQHELTMIPQVTEEAHELPKIPPSGIESGLNDLRGLVSSFPAVAVALDGAVSVYRQKTPDWGRQAVGSMRNALETLIKGLSGESDWRTGLEKIVSSESARKPILVTYSMLCAKGPHSGEIPTEDDVLFCIRLAQEEIAYILKCCKTGKSAA
jgi:hypothetical protein